MPFCNPDEIYVSPDRFRNLDTNHPKVVERAESIRLCGQLQPILVASPVTPGNTKRELVDGLIRLRACQRLGREVWWEDEETARLILENRLQRRRAELQANLCHLDFTPAEEACGIAELDELMKETFGERTAGGSYHGGEHWSYEKTAKMLGYKSKQTVADAVAVARAVKSDSIPAIKQAKTMTEAFKMVKDAVRIEAQQELSRRRAAVADTEVGNPIEFFGSKLLLGECPAVLSSLSTGVCNLFITDPPFALELDKVIEGRGEVLSRAQGVYEDDPEIILPVVKGTVEQIARIGKPLCQVVMFCATQYWSLVCDWFRAAGFEVHKKPLIWVKASTDPFRLIGGRTSNPKIFPGSAYEAAVYAWRGNVILAKQGLPDVFVHPTVPSSVKFHPAQKPVSLMEEIISRFYYPGTNPLLIDPFVGSGSTLVAARRLGIKNYLGYEKDPVNRERAISFMVQDYLDSENKKDEEVDLEGF